jgi:hypothetical protein
MATRTLISVEEYLSTSYRPDCDYVDGEVVERNLGEWDHSSLQSAILVYLWNRYYKDGIRAVAEQRVQVNKTRFRIPDVCVVLGEPGEQILTKPPLICIADYFEMGVPYVWARSRDQASLHGHPRRRPARTQVRRAQNRKPRARSSTE